MKVDYISDLHVDFYFEKEEITIEEFKATKLYEIFKDKEGEVLVIAGDIGHYNKQNLFILKAIKEFFNYKKIFFVLGNHDYYLLNNLMIEKYNSNSINRINDMKNLCDEEKDIHLLTGNIIEYKGIKFGGTGMWYDGVYLQRLNLRMTKEKVNEIWEDKMRDAGSIYGIQNYKTLFQIEIENLRNCYEKSDILITHVNPSINPSHTHRKYILNELNGFYSFDGDYYLENTKAKYWIFGHTHKNIEYDVYNTKVICNPLGYPHENIDFELESFVV